MSSSLLLTFTNGYGTKVAIPVSKILSIYENSPFNGKPRTFIETAPEGTEDNTGPVVEATFNEVIAAYKAATDNDSTHPNVI